MAIVGAWLLALFDLVLPHRCAGCRAPGPVLCELCRALLTGPPRSHAPDPCPPGLPPLVAAAPYVGPVRAMLVAHKERARLALTRPLGVALARAVAELGAEVLVPVPSSGRAVRARGHDHGLRLACAAARVLRIRCVPALRLVRRTADSAGLDAAGRAANLVGAMAVRPSRLGALAGCRVVLVDDLVTTGASMAEAARTLREAGVAVAGAAVVGATERHAARPPPGRRTKP